MLNFLDDVTSGHDITSRLTSFLVVPDQKITELEVDRDRVPQAVYLCMEENNRLCLNVQRIMDLLCVSFQEYKKQSRRQAHSFVFPIYTEIHVNRLLLWQGDYTV